jgi:hypothetical protein
MADGRWQMADGRWQMADNHSYAKLVKSSMGLEGSTPRVFCAEYASLLINSSSDRAAAVVDKTRIERYFGSRGDVAPTAEVSRKPSVFEDGVTPRDDCAPGRPSVVTGDSGV